MRSESTIRWLCSLIEPVLYREISLASSKFFSYFSVTLRQKAAASGKERKISDAKWDLFVAEGDDEGY